MALTITDFIEQVDGISTDDIPLDERERINDALANVTGGEGGEGGGEAGPVNEDAILVSKDLNDRAGFTSIQDAIDGENPQNGASGAGEDDTIFVEPSEYTESVTIDVSGLTLKAADGASPTIEINEGSRTNITADDVTINGFSVVFKGQAAYIRGDNVTVEDNTFELESGTTSSGYALRYEGLTSDGEVRNNEFVDITNDQSGEFGNGVIIAGPDGHEVVGNTFDGNSIGVNVGSQKPAGELLVSNNTFTSQDDFGVALNHDDSGSPIITISSNDFDSNPTGVLALSGGDIDISSNEFTGDSSTVYVDDQVDTFTLPDVLNDQGNTFDPVGVIEDNTIVPAEQPAEDELIVTKDENTGDFNAVQNALDNVESNETIFVYKGDYTDEGNLVTPNTDETEIEDVTLFAQANAVGVGFRSVTIKTTEFTLSGSFPDDAPDVDRDGNVLPS